MLQEAYVTELKRVGELEVELRDCIKKFQALESEHNGCVERLCASQEEAAKNLKAMQEIQAEFDEFAEKVNDINAKYAVDTKEVIIEHIMRTRAEMMLEYKKGEWESWAVDETIKEYNEKYPSKALVLTAADESEHQPSQDDALDYVQNDVQGDVQDVGGNGE